MTAINAPLSRPANTTAFRRGLLTGFVASVVLAISMASAALSSGVVHIGEPAALVPAVEQPAPVVPVSAPRPIPDGSCVAGPWGPPKPC